MEKLKINRLEIINHSKKGKGREYVLWDEDVEFNIDYQDNERTLKIFIRDKDAK